MPFDCRITAISCSENWLLRGICSLRRDGPSRNRGEEIESARPEMISGSKCRHLNSAGRGLIMEYLAAYRPVHPVVATQPSRAIAGQATSANCRTLMERAILLSTGPSLRVRLAEILNDLGLNGGNALEQAEREQIVRALRASN